MRSAKKEQDKLKKQAEDATKSRLEAVKPCETMSQTINFAAFETDFIDAAQKAAEGQALPTSVSAQQAELMLIELGFIEEKRNEDFNLERKLLALIASGEEGEQS